jgi:hypothetical protein
VIKVDRGKMLSVGHRISSRSDDYISVADVRRRSLAALTPPRLLAPSLRERDGSAGERLEKQSTPSGSEPPLVGGRCERGRSAIGARMVLIV